MTHATARESQAWIKGGLRQREYLAVKVTTKILRLEEERSLASEDHDQIGEFRRKRKIIICWHVYRTQSTWFTEKKYLDAVIICWSIYSTLHIEHNGYIHTTSCSSLQQFLLFKTGYAIYLRILSTVKLNFGVLWAQI